MTVIAVADISQFFDFTGFKTVKLHNKDIGLEILKLMNVVVDKYHSLAQLQPLLVSPFEWSSQTPLSIID